MLKRDLLKIYSASVTNKSSYHTVKRKLLEYDANVKHLRKLKAKKDFRDMKQEGDQNLFVFSAKLEKCFIVAYPDKNAEKSKKLRTKFLVNVPDSVRTMLDMQIMMYRSEGKWMKWKKIQNYACIYEQREIPETDKIININVQHDCNQQQYERERRGTRPKEFRNQNYKGQRSNQWRGDTSRKERTRQGRWNTNDYNRNPKINNKELREKRDEIATTQEWVPRCFKCTKLGHLARECYAQLECDICNKKGHPTDRCWYKDRNKAVNDQRRTTAGNSSNNKGN